MPVRSATVQAGQGQSRIGAVAALCLSWALAGPAVAGPFEDLAACFTVQHGLDGLTAAFVEDGWTVVTDGPDSDRAAAATSEINWALRTTPGRFKSAAKASEFLATAHHSHALRTDPYALLVKDDRSLILEYSTNGARGQNICLMAAAEIDYVGAMMPPGAVDPDRGRYFASVEVPLMRAAKTIRYVRAAVARLRVPEAASDDLVGGDGVQISVTYKWE